MAESSPNGRQHCGKRRNCSLRALSPFPTVVSKDLHRRHGKKTGFVWERVKIMSQPDGTQGSTLKSFGIDSPDEVTGKNVPPYTVWLNPFPNKPWFLRVCSTNLLKTLREKEKPLVTSNFSFFLNVFLPIWRTFRHFHQTQNCRLQTLSVWKSLKCFVWKGLRHYQYFRYFKFYCYGNQGFLCK